MRPKTLFTIVEGGERTYIHPYSYSENVGNTVKFLKTPEFAPHQVETETDSLYRYQKGLYRNLPLYVARSIPHLVKFVWKFAKDWSKFKFSFQYLEHCWTTIFPVYCADIYRGNTISVPGTLLPSDPGQKLTDTCYLIPSQEWIKRKLGEWLTAPNPEFAFAILTDPKTGKVTSFYDYERNSYLTWADSQVKLGRKIAFLTSLDT